MINTFRWVKPGSTIYSDYWKAYLHLGEIGYKHGTVNHSHNFVNPQNPIIHTQSIEMAMGIENIKIGFTRKRKISGLISVCKIVATTSQILGPI